jgi:hypothetical protein
MTAPPSHPASVVEAASQQERSEVSGPDVGDAQAGLTSLTRVAPTRQHPATVRIGGRDLQVSPVFDSYWTFASERQQIYLSRLRGKTNSWTKDPVLQEHRFTNVFRAADRISQFLINKVQRGPGVSQELIDQVFRTLLFKIFNREETWLALENAVGPIEWRRFDFDAYRSVLEHESRKGPLYSGAYLMPPPKLGERFKYENHLRLLEMMIAEGLAGQIRSTGSLQDVYELLLAYPGIGPFLAFQYAIDLNYSDIVGRFDEDDFVVAGPGAKDGIRKCFGRSSAGIEADIIRYMVDHQEEHFERLDLPFRGLFGRRLHLIDAQNVFCEVDKYARVAHPDVAGISGRTRIKQKFSPAGPLTRPAFPRRWGLTVTLEGD